MKRTITIIGVALALIAGAVAIGWLYYRANPAAWDAFLAEMSGESSGGTAVARPVFQPIRRTDTLRASGTIEAAEITIAAEQGGRVLAIMADEGDEITADMELLQLDDRILQAQREGALAAVAQANAAREAAQAQLELAQAGATPAEIAAAESAVMMAEGNLAATAAQHQQAEINVDSALTVAGSESSVAMAEAALAEAEGALAAANANLARATAERDRVLNGARPQEIAIYQAQVDQAYAQYLLYENIHFVNFIDKDIGGWPEEQARYQVDSARGAWDAAQAQLDLALAGALPSEVTAAQAVVAAAEAQVNIAEAGVAAAEAGLEAAQAAPETTQNAVALADAGITVADAQIAVAEGQLAQAQAHLDRLIDGATPEEIAVLQAQVAQAEASLTAAEAFVRALDVQISQTTLIAPVDGVVIERLLQVGELATPGAPLFTLANLDEVTLTVYVPEADLGTVYLGQAVEVSVDAYDTVFAGEVSHIANQAEFTPKNVQTEEERVHMVFAVKIRLENSTQLLKPGMPADAMFAD
jgi:HlyD family secretion protein